MIRRFTAIALAAGLMTSPVAALAQAYPPQPPIGSPKPFTVPSSTTYTLPNGVQVTLIPYGQVPKAAVSLRVYAGALNEGEDVSLATLTSQMMREGAGGRSATQLAETAASMGGNLGVGTSAHETTFSLNVLSERAGDAVRLVSDVARRPDFPAKDFERIRQNFARGIAVAKSQPQTSAEVALASAIYGNHPYGRLIPSDAQLAGYKLEDLRRFHQQNFGAKRARIYVAGRFDEAQVRAAIQQALGDWQPGPERLSLKPTPQPGPRLLLINRPNAPQSTLRIAFPAPAAGTTSDIPFRVTNALLGGSFTSRITKNIREEKGYTYSPNSGIGYNPGEALWTFNADVTTEVTGAAMKEVLGEMRKLQTEAPGDEEATGMRTWMAGTFVLQNASPGGLIGSLANRDFHGLPANWLENYVPGVLAVNAADMQRLAREQLPIEKATIVVVGDLAKVEPQLKALPELKDAKFERITPF